MPLPAGTTVNLSKYQNGGVVARENEAYEGVNLAREATPEELRPLFRSSIKWIGDGLSEWYWLLK